MRKFRNSALAIATATTVAFGGVSVASAEDVIDDQPIEMVQPGEGPSLSNEVAGALGSTDLDQPVNLQDVFGLEKDFSQVPNWAKALYGITVAAGIASFIGLIAGPVYNFFTYNMFG